VVKILNLKVIEVDPVAGPECVDATTNMTQPILDQDSTNGAKMPNNGLTGSNVFNLYRANPQGLRGSDHGYGVGGIKKGFIAFGVDACAQSIDFDVVGRRDVYTSPRPFDTIKIEIEGVQVYFRQNTGQVTFPSKVNGIYVPELDGIDSFSETFTHTINQTNACGFVVNITGESGSLANNDVGYDVKVTVNM
jgi:hypothetical protein|tara:strand:+ start:623 stop:1198 length:576 start_codon:yes stop_codon:yes gene_type:complete